MASRSRSPSPSPSPRPTRSCAAMAARCAPLAFRPTARGALRLIRFLGDPLVADAQHGRAGAALPRRRRERGRAARRWARRDRSAPTAASRSGAPANPRPTPCCPGTPRRWWRSPFRPTAQCPLRPSWDNRVRVWPVAGGSPARARRPQPERQRRRVHAGRQGGGERVLRSHAAHLAAHGAPATIITLPAPLSAVAVAHDGEIVAAAQSGAVWFLDAAGRELQHRAGRADAGDRARGLARRRAGRGRRHPRLGRGDRTREPQARAYPGRARACRRGRSRSCPTTAPCSPAAPTGWSAAGTHFTGDHIGAVAMGRRGSCSRPTPATPARRLPRLRRLPHAHPRRGQPRRPDARRHLRPPHRLAARLQIPDALKPHGHRVDARDGRKTVRVGPAAYTPGTKMPEQRIGAEADRKALVEFLAKATVVKKRRRPRGRRAPSPALAGEVDARTRGRGASASCAM